MLRWILVNLIQKKHTSAVSLKLRSRINQGVAVKPGIIERYKQSLPAYLMIQFPGPLKQ
jgi:hypothetical protein